MSADDVKIRSRSVASMYTSGRAELMTADEVMVIDNNDTSQHISKRGREEDNNNTNNTTNPITDNETNPDTETVKPVLKIKLPKKLLKVVSDDAKMDIDDTNDGKS